MSKTKGLLLAVAVATMAFTFSCSSDDGDGDGGSVSSSSGDGNQLSSSSSVVQCLNTGNGTFTDDRDGEEYKYVTICSQIWMAENLNYEAEGKCYGEGGMVRDGETWITLSPDEIQANCLTYGRLYDWATAMALDPSCNSASCSDEIQSPHHGICPEDWHLPSRADWDVMTAYIGGWSTGGKKLKATSDWNSYSSSSGNGTDDYGFSALPGGSGGSSGHFGLVGFYGVWWSTNENEGNSSGTSAYGRGMNYNSNDVGLYVSDKGEFFSVRCVKNTP